MRVFVAGETKHSVIYSHQRSLRQKDVNRLTRLKLRRDGPGPIAAISQADTGMSL